jgi:hypothetical protein
MPYQPYDVAASHSTTVGGLQAIIDSFNASVAAEQTFWGPPP